MTDYPVAPVPADAETAIALALDNPMPRALHDQVANWIEPHTVNTYTDHADAMMCVGIAYPLIRASLAGDADRWRTAFESLHARILRDLPGDGSELPAPEDPFWAAQLDGLTAYADELYRETETEAS